MSAMLQPAVQGTSGVGAFSNHGNMPTTEQQHTELAVEDDDTPSVDIIISNVVGTFSTRCHLNLKRIAMEGTNVEYHRQHGVKYEMLNGHSHNINKLHTTSNYYKYSFFPATIKLWNRLPAHLVTLPSLESFKQEVYKMLNMRIRRPYTTASIWSSGKITCTGATSEDDSRIAGRKFARKLQKMGYKVKFTSFRVVNVLGSCSLPFKINIDNFSRARKEASYEPEIHPAVTYRIREPKATLKIFSTGSITVTAPRVANIQSAIEYIFPLVSEFNAGKSTKFNKSDLQTVPKFVSKKQHVKRQDPLLIYGQEDDLDSEDYDSMDSDDDFESDESQD